MALRPRFSRTSRTTPGRAAMGQPAARSPATARQPHRLLRRHRSMIRGIQSATGSATSTATNMLRFRRPIPLRQAIAAMAPAELFHAGNGTFLSRGSRIRMSCWIWRTRLRPLQPEAGHSRSNAPNGRTSRGTGSVSLGKGRVLSPVPAQTVQAWLSIAAWPARRYRPERSHVAASLCEARGRLRFAPGAFLCRPHRSRASHREAATEDALPRVQFA